jgi:DNA-binding NarL/FixJ family response regulator
VSLKAETAPQVLELIQNLQGGSTASKWWTQSQPIRTLAEMHVTFALLETRPLFLYERVAEKARELSRLGMSASAIARTLKISDKTVSKALR